LKGAHNNKFALEDTKREKLAEGKRIRIHTKGDYKRNNMRSKKFFKS